ncbi:4Fe-4S dicluster domain-containing protein [Streptomyces sp. WAC 00631]|uniref:4Fe-4S dicluster domain-containing protein n=1 Tax=Streptomyces sp. WAC 00631 TaxID=2203201 RepID=UPI000F76ACD2|nr:4Fe-4S dicluster domain-containing protein [Streptomyces sp. WAC 00631]MCC5036923.1 4Fe-4S dicluster domain-containing protein [Streptomyces sp. WAC 00631]
MAETGTDIGAPAVLDRDGLDALVKALAARGRTVIGPTVRDGAVVLAEIDSGDRLPYGWGVELAAGRYRLRRRTDGAAFAHSAGPQSWKTYLHPERVRQWSADRAPDGGLTVTAGEGEGAARPSFAFLGVRPCDLRAIAVQDRVLAGGRHPDGVYRARRERAFIVAVECTEPGETCFCVSMGSGPAAENGYDLALTELTAGGGGDTDGHGDGEHRFLVRVGSEEGAAVLEEVAHRPAGRPTAAAARDRVTEASRRMGRAMPPVDLRRLMGDSLDSAHWDDIAERCLSCGNCTLVCPTCFCTTTEDVTDLTGDHAERWRRWDSCFDLDFSFMHGGPVRSSVRSRHRQWMTHKLATWYDQFGSSGCVGCGRCVVWCPAGIDITEEAAEFHARAREAESGRDGPGGDGRTGSGVPTAAAHRTDGGLP